MTPTNQSDLDPAAAGVLLPSALERKKTKRLLTALWLASILIAALHCWVDRHSINPDGVTYMDISDAYRAGHWTAALNIIGLPLPAQGTA